MKNKIIQKNSFIFLATFLFLFLFFSSSLVSATAVWNNIPDKKLGFGTSGYVDLRDYCSSNAGRTCELSSYSVQFINPDNNQQIGLLSGSPESSNSYFTISLGSNGILNFFSKSKAINSTILVAGADQPYQSQNATKSFKLIIGSQKPIQLASLNSVNLFGTEFETYFLYNFFLYEEGFKISYQDSNLSQSVFLQTNIIQGEKCIDGQIKVCLSQSQVLTLKGANQNFNGSIIITAFNGFGESSTNIILKVTPASINYLNVPARKPISIAPVRLKTTSSDKIYIQYGEIVGNFAEINFNNFYSNYTYLNISFSIGVDNYTLYSISNISTPYSFNATYNGNKFVFKNPTLITHPSTFIDYFAIAFENYNYTNNFLSQGWRQAYAPNILYIAGLDKEINITLNISACNNIGCTSSDGFGNKDQLFLSIQNDTSLPESIPISHAPIILKYFQTKSINMNDYYFNYDYVNLYWNDNGIQTMTTPSHSYNYFISTTGSVINYEAKLYFNNIFSVTSTNQDYNFNLTIEGCKTGGYCTNGSLSPLVNVTQQIYIRENSTLGTLTDIEISDSGIRFIYNWFFGLFPDADNLNSKQKANISFISILIVCVIILFLGFGKVDGKILVYISGFIGIIMFLFFTIKGYISPIILGVVVLISILVLFLKFKGGGN